MKPRLYQSGETAFTSLGIGILEECVECKVKEERNGVFECNFKYPVNGRLIKEIIPDRWIMCDASDGNADPIGTGIRTKPLKNQRFKITTISKPMKGYISVYCEHCSYLSARLMIQPSVEIEDAARSGALSAWKNALVDENGTFSIATDTDGTTHSSTTWNIKDVENARQALGGVRGSILDVWGGEYKFDNYTIGLYTHRGDDNGVTIRYGKNLTDINQEENIANTYTSIYPFATYTDEEQVEHVVTLDSPYYVDSAHASDFESRRILRVDFSGKYQQDEIPDKTSLRQYALNYIADNNIGVPDANIKLSYLDLSKTVNYQEYKFLEKVSLCDTVHVYFEQLGINTTAKVISLVWDVINERVDSVEIGGAKASLSDTIQKQQSEISETKSEIKERDQNFKRVMDAAIDRATDAITGAAGGCVVLRPKDHPQEILIMNTDDVETAQYVWRWTLGGLGFSDSGVDGPYTTAITNGGEIVADFITTGQLNAGLIKAGILQGLSGNSYWNLGTGDFYISGGDISGDTTIGGDSSKTLSGLDARTTGNSNAITLLASAESELNEKVDDNNEITMSYIESNYTEFQNFKKAYEDNQDEINAYLQYGPNIGFIVGDKNKNTKIHLDGEKINLISGNNTTAYIAPMLMSIHNVEVIDSVKIGGFFFNRKPTGGFSVTWKGVD